MVPRLRHVLASLRRPALTALALGLVLTTAARGSLAEGEAGAAEGVAELRSGVASPVAAVRESARADLERALIKDPSLVKPLLAAWSESSISPILIANLRNVSGSAASCGMRANASIVP